MSRCADRRFRDALHAYELGQLEGDELFAFEQHLLACEECFNEVAEFQDVARRLLGSAEIRSAVRRSVKDLKAGEARDLTGRRRLLVWIPVALAAMLVLLLKPWTIEIRPTVEAIAAQNLLLVTCFDKPAADVDLPWPPEVLATLLVADFSESRFVQPVSRERMLDLLKARGMDGPCPPDGETALDMARDIGARWLLSGLIVPSVSGPVVQTQLIEVSSGNTIATQVVTIAPSDDVFAVTDRLAAEVRTELLLPSDLAEEIDRPVADITTSSQGAYARYVEGLECLRQYDLEGAVQSFEAAIADDSSFAMAYYHLAGLTDPELIYRALDYADHATQKERLFIESRAASIGGNTELAIEKAEKLVERYPGDKQAYALLGDYYLAKSRYERAAANYGLAVVLDSTFAHALNQLAFVHALQDDPDRALAVLDAYAARAPLDPVPFDTRAEILAMFGRLDEAVTALDSALARSPDICPSRVRLGMLYMFRGEFDRADSCFDAVAEDGSCTDSHFARLLKAGLYVREGRLGAALGLIDHLLGDEQTPAEVHGQAITCKAMILSETGRDSAAFEVAAPTFRSGGELYPDLARGFQSYYVMLVAAAGDTSGARTLVEHLRTFSERGRMRWNCYVAARGYNEFPQKRYADAARFFRQVADELVHPLQANWFERNWMYARVLLEAGDFEKAISGFERTQGAFTYERALWSAWDVESQYYLGRAYELAGDREQALRHYESFLALWSDADLELTIVQDARRRLASLSS